MSGHKLRNEKTCLNCGHTVADHFCSHCGQENIEPRQTFHYLFTHFFEDLTHYDGKFWKTIKFLLFRPGRLTREFLAGRRMRYVPPVRLYIFLNFITFLLPVFLFPGHDKAKPKTFKEREQELVTDIAALKKAKDSLGSVLAKPSGLTGNIKAAYEEKLRDALEEVDEDLADETRDLNALRTDTTNFDKSGSVINIGGGNVPKGVHSVAQLDSVQKIPGDRMSKLDYVFAKKHIELWEYGYSNNQIRERMREAFIHNIPKALFLYMPLFAFFLWLFHRKKKWWFFDHGIFTLHYFCFLLLLVTLLYFVLFFSGLAGANTLAKTIEVSIIMAASGYSFFYFFRAHSRVYGERKGVSRLKGFALFIINVVLILAFLLGLVLYSFYTLH
ncbi:DUF3667 domain-containing protein [Niabella beijingensis]|uniref:DUF3667 domain-containing protein n=1 Tax=Niabella beijingensis TaxID=2872700 RepID=UPI001CC0F1C1|nr:DUF3667 domain-containing protein [Niabella beijingensis]MBZ4190103.1 DUF3667 domain-containing protein [Niabella beijingensis]